MKLAMSPIPCSGCFHASGKHENFKDLVTDLNHWLGNRELWQGKAFVQGFVLLPVPTAAFGLAVLLCSSLLLHWMVQQGAQRHKSKGHRHWILAGPAALQNPSSFCSTFHSDYLFIDCMTKTCNQIKYRWEDSLDKEICYQTLAAKLCEIAPRNS